MAVRSGLGSKAWRSVRVLGTILGVLAGPGCSSSDAGGGSRAVPDAGSRNVPASGTEGGPCYPNDTCNTGLACLSHLCVNAGTGGAGSGGANFGGSNSGGTAGAIGSGGGSGNGNGGTAAAGGNGNGGTAGAGGGATGGTGAISGTGGADVDASVEPDAAADAGHPETDASHDASAPSVTQIDECPGPLASDVASALALGGSVTTEQLLYPYDGTVFPNGIPAPTLQWDTGSADDAVFVHLTSARFEYRGCFGANSKERLDLPANVWSAALSSRGGESDPLEIAVTVKHGTSIVGPIPIHVVLAQGTLGGTVFYDTYTSPQASNNGAIMRLRIGQTTPEVFLTDTGVSPVGPCWNCHSVSAAGNAMVADHQSYPLGSYTTGSFDLVANPGTSPPPTKTVSGSTADFAFAAFFPDGSKFLTSGSPGDSAGQSVNPFYPAAPGNVPFMVGPQKSKLYDAKTGSAITLSGFSPQYAKMPSFSPDGTKIAFNWHEDSNGHSLAVADFASSTNTASNVRVVFKHDTLYPGWPTITADNREIVFALGNAADYVSSFPDRPSTAASDLWIVDIATKTARPLAKANGYSTDGAPTYLPRAGRDEHLGFFPNVSPEAAGGYFWLFFTSRRTYGNLITDETTNLHSVDDTVTKKIWVSALRVESSGLVADPSFPPFYLPGQEAVAGNFRPTHVPSP